MHYSTSDVDKNVFKITWSQPQYFLSVWAIQRLFSVIPNSLCFLPISTKWNGLEKFKALSHLSLNVSWPLGFVKSAACDFIWSTDLSYKSIYAEMNDFLIKCPPEFKINLQPMRHLQSYGRKYAI